MYIWKIDKLNEQLISGKLKESDAFKYLMAYTIMFALASIQYGNPNQYDTFGDVVSFFVCVIGLLYIYKCNGGQDGKNIIERYLTIGLVVLVRFTALLLVPGFMIVFTLQELYMGGVPEETDLISAIMTQVFLVIYILWVAKYIKFVADHTNA